MSAVYDKNLERVREIEKKVAAGAMTSEAGEKRIKTLRAVPDYWIKVYDGPIAIRRHVEPSDSEAAAKRLERKLVGEIAAKTFVPDDLMRTSIGTILDAYLLTQEGKGGCAATKSRIKTAAPIRHVRLEVWHNDTKAIVRHLEGDSPDHWSDKSIWNYAKTLQFAVQRFIDTHQKLNIKNPVRTAIKSMGLEEGTRRREVVPSDFEVSCLLAEARKDEYPTYIAPLLSFLRETGLREVEALSMKWEKVSLDFIPGKTRPYAEVRLMKKKKVTVRRIPLNPKAFAALKLLQVQTAGQTETGFVFPVRNFPGRIWRRIRAAVSLQHINPHDFRKSWSVEHLTKGKELRKEVRGHDTDEMDEYYMVLSLKDAEKIYDEEWQRYERNPNEN